LRIAQDDRAVGATVDAVNAFIAALHVQQNVLMHGDELDSPSSAFDPR
jgi:hypothetical protein